MAFQVADVVAAMEADVGKPLRELRVDGGAARNAALLQFQSDLVRSRVVRAAQSEATALGAAFFAGLAIGFWKEREALTALWRAPRVFSPQMPAHLAKTRREGWREAVRRVRGWTPP
jgi:glycerol kinase